MSNDAENVLPETLANLAHARCTSGSEWRPPYRNIGALLSTRAVQTPEKNFLTYYDDNGLAAAYTCVEFYDLVRRLATLMTEQMGVTTGDRIATLCVNDARTVLIYFSAWLLGATVVPVNCSEDDDRVAYILANSQAKVAFAMSDQVARLEAMGSAMQASGNATWIVRLALGARASRPHPEVLGARASRPHPEAFMNSPGAIPLVNRLNEDKLNENELKWIEVDALGGAFDACIAATEPLVNAPDVGLETECLIVYTSGTTGAPKGVVLEQSNLLQDAESIASWHRFGPDDRAMCVLPIHHVNGTIVTLMTPLFSGGSVVLNRRFHALSFWSTLATERCTWVSVVPTVLAFLCERKADLTQFDLSRFRHIICGAGPLTVELAHRFDTAFGVRVVHGYGLSETTCYSCFLPIDLDREAYVHWMFECGFPSIGCPISANEMAIHDAEGNPLPPDVRGEIVIRGYNVMRYYFKRPDANRDTFAHGWFRSGDEGFYRKGTDGLDYYFITGRLKELFIRGGINYSPFDIDEVLTAISGVKAAMAVGFENNFYGEEIGAYVQLEEGATLTAEQILSACREKLPYSKSPKVVLFGTEFPVTSTGKYQRNRLKPLFAEWKDAQFREEKKVK